MLVEECASIDVAGVLIPPSGAVDQTLRWYQPPNAPSVRVPDTRPCVSLAIVNQGRQLASVEVEIATTRLYHGGVRHWFVCRGCGGRAKKLYSRVWQQFGRPLSAELGCRQCLNLVYECQYRKRASWNWLW